MKEPKVGDRRPLKEKCSLCGAIQYEEYQCWSAYHNDTECGWGSKAHLKHDYRKGTDLYSCLEHTIKRLKVIERKLASKGSTTQKGKAD